MPWRNGGGQTRELLAWPEPSDWIVRISVAEIRASGPFSDYPGVDRWFAVLRGGAVRLETRGAGTRELGAGQLELHAFPGDAPTHCSALGAATRDFNVMLRRTRGRLRQRALDGDPTLRSSAGLVALFAVETIEVSAGAAARFVMPGMALAWWNNPCHAPLALAAHAAGSVRGWWLEADATS
ncbi:MAG: HutD family protein [Gammaproteobacteria bacterium]|nr:HutD family protein [Gammaproteobacteria bacterium]